MNFPYEDIVSLPRPVSPRHARMSNADRAAQFSAFAALSGHGDAILETARLTDGRAELHEDEIARLNEALLSLSRRLSDGPEAEITYFVRDARKSGGAYVTEVCHVIRIDPCFQELVTREGLRLPMEDIYAIREILS